VLVDEITGYDFSKAPPLQENFMKRMQHNVPAAMQELRRSVKGFFVEMPLEWGKDEKQTPLNPAGSAALIATNEEQLNGNKQTA
jgi:phospholipase D1/2